ncbi:MAG: C4-type zinc ribbon domain-containing protein [Thermoanaerobaculia bacterium]|nr:C4-type zinc ribbon domain-containing protein [Thermoanaerobaculia bacterium]
MARDLDSLVQLQHALHEAETARRELGGVPDSMREIHEQHLEHSERIRALEAEIQEAELARRSSEAAVADAQQKLAHFQSQVNRVTTQREYGSLLKEIDAVKEEIDAHEEVALAMLETVEAARAEIETQKGEFADLDRQYQEMLAGWEEQKPAVAARLAEVEADIEKLQETLPRHLVGQFHRLYERHGGEAFASISRVEASPRAASVWHCSVCNYSVRPQVIVEIKNNGSLIPCESCQRFLYIEEES